MNVVIIPGTILCGACGQPIFGLNQPVPPNFGFAIQCQNLQCTEVNKPHMMPLMGMALEPIPQDVVEASQRRIIVPNHH